MSSARLLDQSQSSKPSNPDLSLPPFWRWDLRLLLPFFSSKSQMIFIFPPAMSRICKGWKGVTSARILLIPSAREKLSTSRFSSNLEAEAYATAEQHQLNHYQPLLSVLAILFESLIFKMPSPIVTATIQAAGLSTASNILAQIIEARQQNVSSSHIKESTQTDL